MRTAKSNTTTRNQQRIAAALATRAAHHATRITARNQAAYLHAVQQLAAQYGIAAPTQALRSINTKQQHAPSTVQGACKTVRAWCATNPTATVAQAKAHFAGTINPATVQTQHGIARKQAQQ